MQTSTTLDEHGHLVWVKVAETPAETRRLSTESATLDALDHPNVVELRHCDGRRLVTALAGRSDLATSPPADHRELADLTQALTHILCEIHRIGWAHGAVEPAHVIRGPGGRLVVCSWGRARRITGEGAPAAHADRRAVTDMVVAWQAALGPARSGQDRQAARRVGAVLDGARDRRTTSATTSPPRRSGARRSRALRDLAVRVAGFGALAATAWTLALPGWDRGPSGALATAGWWTVRVGALYGLAVSGAWLVATAARSPRWVRGVRRLAPAALRPVLVGVTAASALAQLVPTRPGPQSVAPPAPAARPARPPPAPVERARPDGPRPTAPAPEPPDAPADVSGPGAADRGDRWLVRPGDHFWRIATRTLAARRGREPSDAEVARYWAVLVAANRHLLADPANPDLVFPGQRFVLPP